MPEPLRAALYARKSTDQGSVADEAKSVARQLDHARQYAAAKGWIVDETCVFVDDGISGAEFARRPGFVRLMAALAPRPRFQVLIMSEESRLGRETIETGYALKQLVRAGVRVFFYLEDRERTLDSPTDKILMSLTAFADELEREKARQRVTDTMTRKAKAGHVTGGRVFGYDNLEIRDASGRRAHVERRINEPEAAVVRRIFELAAAGVGQARAARQLNADGALAPRSQQGRPRAWAPSSVHEILFRPLYRGEIVWNRTKKRDRWGEHKTSDRPAEEWVRLPAPTLRIVPEVLWQAAHARIDLARRHYQAVTKGSRSGRPRDVESKYLLPGLARCGCCHGGLHVRTSHHGSSPTRRRAFFYACTSHFNRGATVCENALRVRMETVDAAVLDAVGEILSPEMVEDIVRRVRALLASPEAPDPRVALETQIADSDRQLGNLAEAIALGGSIPVLVQRLQTTRQARQALEERLTAIAQAAPVLRLEWAVVERRARALLQDWRGLLTRQVTHGRALLREILTAPIQFTPFHEEGRRGYRFTGTVSLGPAFVGVVEVMRLASPHVADGALPVTNVPFSGEIILSRRAA